jgi:hypothetical protein
MFRPFSFVINRRVEGGFMRRSWRGLWTGFWLVLAGAANAAPALPPPTLAAVAQFLPGTWESGTDTRFSREFRADGTVVDRVEGEGEDTQFGTWRLFTGKTPPPEFARRKDLIPDAIYLEVREGEDTLLYGVAGVGRATLQMVDMTLGAAIIYSRLK